MNHKRELLRSLWVKHSSLFLMKLHCPMQLDRSSGPGWLVQGLGFRGLGFRVWALRFRFYSQSFQELGFIGFGRCGWP